MPDGEQRNEHDTNGELPLYSDDSKIGAMKPKVQEPERIP